MKSVRTIPWHGLVTVFGLLALLLSVAYAQEAMKSSYSPVVSKESFQDTMKRMERAKPGIMKRSWTSRLRQS